jgi:hypothetical protein
MAIALNVFKTVTYEITTTLDTIYTAPAGKSAIILMAQIANITSGPLTVTFASKNGTTNIITELVKEYTVPGNDALSAITGKLVLETGGSLLVQGSDDHSLKITLSVLESVNG